ncbi:protein NSP-INTERACTING KINASE [Trifolium repens]|nr:protein NSP-INTERACTING KINASE [Trifolium repens]
MFDIAGRLDARRAQSRTLPKLQTLDLSNNRFSGFIPSSLSQLNNLQYLRLNNNSLSGPFPVTLAKITQLAFLDLSYNNLSGPLPKFPARSFFNIVGNPLICLSISIEGCSGSVTLMPVPFSQASSAEDVNQPIESTCAILIRTAVDKPVHYECPGEIFVEQPGSARTIVGNSEADNVCHAAWNNLEGTFLARDKKYDRSHNFVYWSVRRDGFYHSWDDTNYEKKYGWNH